MSFIKNAGEPSLYKRPCQHTPEDRQSDLCAQWKSADWTKIGAIVAGLGIGFLLLQIFLTIRALEHTAKATRAMEQQNEIAREDTRPILAFESIDWRKLRDVFGMPPNYQNAHFVWRNVGKRPLRLVSLQVGLEYSQQNIEPDWSTLLETFAERAHDTSGLIIMPDNPHTSRGVLINPLDFQKPSGAPMPDVYLVARAFYANAISGEHERQFSTMIAKQIFPAVQSKRPLGLPPADPWPEDVVTQVGGTLTDPVVAYAWQSVDSVDAVQMT